MLRLSGGANIREVLLAGTCSIRISIVIVVIACKRISSIQLYSLHSKISATDCSLA